MKVVIVEDEVLLAEDLAEILEIIPYNIEVVEQLHSVATAISYFKENKLAELIFCDVQLGDGNCFEIFKQVKIDTPVIFCTAYDEYALEAFQNNGIAYILKPFNEKSILTALEKYQSLVAILRKTEIDYNALLASLLRKEYMTKEVSSLLVNWKDKIIPVKLSDIALFNIDYKSVQLVTFSNRKYFLSQTLDELESTCGNNFFRANRQFLINKECIVEAEQYDARKLILKLKIESNYEVIISKNKVPDFLRWLKFQN